MKKLSSLLLLGVAAMIAASAASAQTYPVKRIELVIPVTPGSATDLLGRIVADKLSARLGQPVVAVNKPGAASKIGAEYVARAAPDGYTLLVLHSGMMANRVVYKGFDLDLNRGFTHVAGISQTPWVVVVHDGLPVRTMAELAAYSKAHPGTLSVGTTGGASVLDVAMLREQFGIDAQTILYPGGTQVMTAVASNEIQLALNAVRGVQTMAGRPVRALAVLSPKRFSLAPDLPTVGEGGGSQYSGPSLWFGLFGPAGMPREITDRLNREVNELFQLPDVAKRLETMGHERLNMSPEAFSTFVEKDVAYYERAARVANYRPE